MLLTTFVPCRVPEITSNNELLFITNPIGCEDVIPVNL
jgi:hypothetical protein